ncbi:MAG: DNA repair protein RecO, partial [Terriglobia bacterium]
PEKRARAIVLSRSVLGDGSKRVELFTDSLGRVFAVAKGAAKVSHWAGLFEPLTLMDVILMTSRTDVEAGGFQTYKIIGADFISEFAEVKRTPEMLAQAAPFVRLAEAVFQPGEPYPECFELLVECLRSIPKCARKEALYNYFNYQALAALGGAPVCPDLLRATPLEICRGKVALPAEEGFKREIRTAWNTALGVEMDPDLIPRKPLFRHDVSEPLSEDGRI